MKSRKPSNPIQDIFEIRLDIAIWRQIILLARQNRISFSWIVRLCVFHFMENDAEWHPVSEKENLELKDQYRDPDLIKHRHSLCLYGDDSILLRICAARLGITISRLVRLALRLYLSAVLKISSGDFVGTGTKYFESIMMNFKRKGLGDSVFQARKFTGEQYWPFRPMVPRTI